MTDAVAAELMVRLRRAGAHVEPGLTDAEIDEVEARFGFEFCDDHRTFLQAGLPVDRYPDERDARWPDWRRGDPERLRARLDEVVEGVVFDILHNDFWPAKWGERPGDMASAEAVGREVLQGVPQLIPLHGNRYLPAGRGTRWPVISAYQTDALHWSKDLTAWVVTDFEELTWHRPVVTRERWVPFWSDIAEGVDPPWPKQPQLLNWPAEPEPLEPDDGLVLVPGKSLAEQLETVSNNMEEARQSGPAVVVDDLRTFPWRKGDVTYAKSSAQGLEVLRALHESATQIGLLSLDYYLGTTDSGMDDTIEPVLDWLVDQARAEPR